MEGRSVRETRSVKNFGTNVILVEGTSIFKLVLMDNGKVIQHNNGTRSNLLVPSAMGRDLRTKEVRTLLWFLPCGIPSMASYVTQVRRYALD